MFKKKFLRFSRSVLKIILPFFFKILIKLKLNRRTINYLHEKSYFSNNLQDFTSIIKKILLDKKILALDVGAQGGFNSDNHFSKKYELFFENILVEPIESEAKKISEAKYLINKGLWSKKEVKKLFLLENRLGSSSMFYPDEDLFDLHSLTDDERKNFKITKSVDIECDTLENSLSKLNISHLDYLKVDTQGAELEILKGMGKYQPLLIKLESHLFSMYKKVPNWNELIDYIYKLNYVVIDWKGIGKHKTRVPAELDMIFIPNFNNEKGKNLIMNSKEKFLSLLLIFGQISLLKLILNKFKINVAELNKIEDMYFN